MNLRFDCNQKLPLTMAQENLLHIACENNSPESVCYILSQRADFNVKNAQGQYPVEIAAAQNNFKIVTIILDSITDAVEQEHHASLALYKAMSSHKYECAVEIVKKHLVHDIPTPNPDSHGSTMMMVVAGMCSHNFPMADVKIGGSTRAEICFLVGMAIVARGNFQNFQVAADGTTVLDQMIRQTDSEYVNKCVLVLANTNVTCPIQCKALAKWAVITNNLPVLQKYFEGSAPSCN
jgi:ankyrin repeat protein